MSSPSSPAGGSPVKQRRRLRKFGESGDSPAASVEVSVKKERPGEDQRSRHRPVKVRPILPVERLASFKKEAARSVFGANESPFRPKSSSLSAAKFVPKRPDARTVGSGEPTLAKAIGKIAREMNASSEEEPMPSSVKVILMNAMKESASKKRREKMKGSSRAAVISTAAHSGSSSRPIHQLLGGGLKAADEISKTEHRKEGQPLTERPLDDVAFGAIEDGIQEYPPLSVPYYSTRRIHHDILRATGYTETSLLDTLKMEGKRPVLVEMAGATVEQESSGVSQLFVEDNAADSEKESSLRQDQFFLVQLPNTFPRVLADKEDDEGKQTAKATQPLAPEQDVASFYDVPDGKLGTLRVHKSGRVTLVIGDIEYSCALGQKPKFAQEVACVLPTQGEVVFLGEIENKLIVSPKI